MEEIQIVSRNAIPPVRWAEPEGADHELGELRDFRWNSLLRDFMPAGPGFSVTWVRLEQGETLEPRVQPTQQLMVFYAGSGSILGDLEGPVVKDDVVVIPAGCRHGFVGGPEGLQALSIQLGEGIPEKPRVEFADPANTLNGVRGYHQSRLQEFKQRPMFELLQDGTLEDPLRRGAFLDAAQIWVRACKALPLGPKASASFGSSHDAAMDAIATWFGYQMSVLDEAERAVIELVIQSGSTAYFAAAAPLFAPYAIERNLDSVPASSGSDSDSLHNQSPRTYARLRGILEEAWDMLSAMSDRVVELTLQA